MKYKAYRFIVNFEKEEKWLNEMAAKGLHFIDFSFPCRYLFEEGTPGEYIYRLEFLNKLPSNAESRAYINFMEESGAELVSTYFRWAWFRKKASEGSFDLYTDYSSKIKHYKRIIWFTGIIGLSNVFFGIWNLAYGVLVTGQRYNVFINAYLSPINFAAAILCICAVAKYLPKLKKLKKESRIHE
ncbi:MAG: DUF2812 domain-containing protein [Clostridia bacterium]|nr:DUF2812 domain-containing protein [Clostridia bacterium]